MGPCAHYVLQASVLHPVLNPNPDYYAWRLMKYFVSYFMLYSAPYRYGLVLLCWPCQSRDQPAMYRRRGSVALLTLLDQKL